MRGWYLAVPCGLLCALACPWVVGGVCDPLGGEVFLEGQAELLGSQTVLLMHLCICSFEALT